MSHQDYRRTSYESWEAMAPGWERRRAELEEALTPVRTWLITQLAPQPGDTVLELGAGPGDTGFAAAALVGEGGRLISSDFSPEMVEVARRRGAELGLENVDHRVIDGERIDLDVASVDGVLCQNGYMLMADPRPPSRNAPRAAARRPPGDVGLGRSGAQSVGVDRRAHPRRARPSPQPGARCAGPFSMASEERTRALLEDAGFTEVRTDEVSVRFAFKDIDEYERWVTDLSGSFAMALRGLPDLEREALRAELRAAFEPYATQDGYELGGVALTALAS